MAIIVAILEFCWNSKKNSQIDHQSLCSEMAEELRYRFAFLSFCLSVSLSRCLSVSLSLLLFSTPNMSLFSLFLTSSLNFYFTKDKSSSLETKITSLKKCKQTQQKSIFFSEQICHFNFDYIR
jgi:hypothetical protein